MISEKMPSYGVILNKFYQYSHMFNKFEKIDSCDQIIDDLDFFKNRVDLDELIAPCKYFKVLDYLTQARQNANYSFDERVIFLILAMDPELEHYKAYLKNVKPTKILDENKIEMDVRKKLDFYERRLLKFEASFFRKFYGKLLDDVSLKCFNNLLELVPECDGFSEVSDDKFSRLNDLKYLFADDVSFNTCAFNILFQNNILDLKSLQEQLALFVMVVEPEMNALKIYEEESNFKMVRKRMFEQFGFYNPNLITLEKMFKARFYPDLELTAWSKYEKK